MTNGKEETNAATEQHLHAMMTAFALSRQEARLTLGLVSGLSLKESAHNIGIRYETARGYLKSVFAKTNCNSQMALVLKIHRSLNITL